MTYARLLTAVLLIFCITTPIGAAEPGQDHPLVGRFEDSQMIEYEKKAFDEYDLLTEKATEYGGKDANREHALHLEGKITRMTYQSVPDASTLEVNRAYEEALEEKGVEFLFRCRDATCGGRDFNHAVVDYDLRFGDNYKDQRYLAAKKTRDGGSDVYVMIYSVDDHHPSQGNRVFTQVDVIEVKGRERKTVVVEADEMAGKIYEKGKVALYGLYFDTDSAEIRSESNPTLREVAKLLEQGAGLKLLVVGHTDNRGGFGHNIDLSRRRAESVTDALEGDFGIERDRLKPWGVGFTSPVASNGTEKGRAENRRVELVEW